MGQKKKTVIIVVAIVGVVAAILFGIYMYIASYFMEHFHIGSKIGAVDVSGMTAAEADEALQQTLDGYQLTIKAGDGTIETISAEEINLAIQWTTTPAEYLETQNGYEWIGKKMNPDTYEMNGEISFDEAALHQKITELQMMQSENQIVAKNAAISEYDAEKGYSLIPSAPGTVIKTDVFEEAIKGCIYALEVSLDVEQGDFYVEPVIKDDDANLLAAIEKLNACLGTQITYQVGNRTQVLDKTIFSSWLSWNENNEIVIDDAAVTAYVNELAATYNTCYSPKKFMTSYNKEITITNSHYGWKVDNAAEKAAIIAEIMAGVPVTRDLKYSMTANSRVGNDYGNSYVEINITAQKVFLYVNGQRIVESDCVSGNLSRNWDTPLGIWGMTYKTTDATLRGADYAVPVDYWMPYAGNVGMHDAQWRAANEFGGNYYKEGGSHGCVNLPLQHARTIYSYVGKNFPVIVYALPGTETEKCIAMDQANAMDKVIQAIGTVTLDSESKITACRAQYDALSDYAKSFVTKYQVLLDAENALETLKKPVVPEKPEIPEVPEKPVLPEEPETPEVPEKPETPEDTEAEEA